MRAQQWTVGDATITSVTEDETEHIPPELFLPAIDATEVRRHPHLVPDYVDEAGNITLRVQAFVVEHGDRCVLVDPCVGNGKHLDIVFWAEQDWPFLERLHAAGFDPGRVDTVVHTHLHADHVGWDTTLVDGRWIPTFPGARYLYTRRELDFCEAGGDPGIDHVYEESVAPIVDAGLADVVAEDADLGDGLRLAPSPGHTPGHVSLWVASDRAVALVSGDFVHHPIQCERPALAEVADGDEDQARATRRAFLGEAAARDALFLGTHFSTEPAGRVVAQGDAWRFHPIPGRPVGESVP